MATQHQPTDTPHGHNERQQAWSRFWSAGPLHCLPGSFAGNYDGGIGAFWSGQFASLEPGHRVLDIGTGNGALPAMLVQLRPGDAIQVDAIDLAGLSPDWLDGMAPEVQQRIRFHGQTSAESLPFTRASFDLAVSQYGIEYTRHEASIAELVRVLKPGGRCALVLHHTGSQLHAVAGDEVTAAQTLLAPEGLLDRAARLLPFLALAAAGQVEQLRADPAASRARAEFNASGQAVGRAAESLRHPQLLIDAQQWVMEMANAVVQRRIDGAAATARLADYRRDIGLARVRSHELCSHALDTAGMQRFAGLLEAAGVTDVSTAPLHHQQYLVGWTLRGVRT